MRNIPESEFLEWAAQANLVPDPRYPHSRQQLVFVNSTDCRGGWTPTLGPDEPAKFVHTTIGLLGNGTLRIRVRGGGFFGSIEDASTREQALGAAALAAGIPADTRGAIEFAPAERQALVDLALAFFLFGFCVGTDLEIVDRDGGVCLLLSHHHEIIGHFANPERLSAFHTAMTAAGYGGDEEEPDR